MENKKGFTLVEIIVVVGLLSIIGVTIGISLNRNIKKNEENKIKEFNQKIKSAANLYASNNESILTNLYEEKGYTLIRVNDLIDAGLISDNLVDPETNEKVTGEEIIKIDLDSSGTINIEYPVKTSEGDYLQTKTLEIELYTDKSTICMKGLNTINLGYIDKVGTLVEGYLNPNGENGKEINIKCNIDNVKTDALGTYEIKYDYQTEDGIWKQTTRQVLVVDKEMPKCPQDIPGGTMVGNTIWKNGPVKIEIPCNDNYKCEKNVLSKVFENIKEGTISISDVSGNTKDCSVYVYSDTSAPINVVISASTEEWTNKSVILTGIAEDSASGVFYYEFSDQIDLTKIEHNATNPGPKIMESQEINKESLTKNGTVYYFYAADLLKNVKRSSNNVIVKIDKNNPTKPAMTFVYGDWTRYNGEWTSRNVFAAQSVGQNDSSKRGPNGSTDALSGIEKYQICASNCNDDKNWNDYNYNLNNSLYKITETGENKRYFRAVDYAGNHSDITVVTAKIDKNKPSINISAKKTNSNNLVADKTWSNEALKYILTPSNVGLSGATISYCKYTGNTECTNFISKKIMHNSDMVTFSYNDIGEYKVKYIITSGAGLYNEGIYTAKVDITAPIITSLNIVENNAQKLKIRANDNLSGVSSYCVKNNNNVSGCNWQTIANNPKNTGEIIITNAYPGKVDYVFVKDAAGNISESKNIDTSCVEISYVEGNKCSAPCDGGHLNREAYDKYNSSTRCTSKDDFNGAVCNEKIGCCDNPINDTIETSSGCTKSCGSEYEKIYIQAVKKSRYYDNMICSYGDIVSTSSKKCDLPSCCGEGNEYLYDWTDWTCGSCNAGCESWGTHSCIRTEYYNSIYDDSYCRNKSKTESQDCYNDNACYVTCTRTTTTYGSCNCLTKTKPYDLYDAYNGAYCGNGSVSCSNECSSTPNIGCESKIGYEAKCLCYHPSIDFSITDQYGYSACNHWCEFTGLTPENCVSSFAGGPIGCPPCAGGALQDENCNCLE